MTEPEAWTQLQELVEGENVEQAADLLESMPADETSRAVSRMDEPAQTHLLTSLEPAAAARLIDAMPDAQAVDLVEQLTPEAAAAIVHELPSNEQADLLGDLDQANADAILTALKPDEARALRDLSAYADDVAGGLMITEVLSFELTDTVEQVIADLRTRADQYRDYEVQYAFVINREGRLMGVLRLRDLLLAAAKEPMSKLMIPSPLSVRDTDNLDQLREFFDDHHFIGVPVVDDRGRLAGVVQRVALEEALAERMEDDYRKSQGIIQEELRTMPVLQRARRRLSWLSINILLNVLAASVIAFYQDTLSQVIALAVFLPIISDMSGCSGNQAVAVSMRELTLGLLRPTELLRVLGKELSVGVLNGLALGGLLAAVAWLWKGNPYLGLVVGSAMTLNTLIAALLGGCLPLLLKRMRMDPALGSGPVLTTVTDMCGFFIVLSLASAMLPLIA